jgi:hypothetical protein
MNNGPLRTGTATLKICETVGTTPVPLLSGQKPDAPTLRQSRSALVLRSSRSCFRLYPNQLANSGQPTLIASSPLRTGFCGQSAQQYFEEWPRFFVDGKGGRFSISSDFGMNTNYCRGIHSMENTFNHQEAEIVGIEPDSETKRKIFEKVAKRMNRLRSLAAAFCAELNPDVIVISDDRSLLFEPQNSQVTEWLRRRFALKNLGIRDRLRVHPCQRRGIIAELKAAGFEVV